MGHHQFHLFIIWARLFISWLNYFFLNLFQKHGQQKPKGISFFKKLKSSSITGSCPCFNFGEIYWFFNVLLTRCKIFEKLWKGPKMFCIWQVHQVMWFYYQPRCIMLTFVIFRLKRKEQLQMKPHQLCKSDYLSVFQP